MKISIIYPVCGYPDPKDDAACAHPFLLSSLDSILRAGNTDFELLIGVDGNRPKVIDILSFWRRRHNLSKSQVRFFEFDFTGSYGNHQRNILLGKATGDYVSFMDHDDEYLPDAFSAIKDVGSRYPNCPLIFRMRMYQSKVKTYSFEKPLELWHDGAQGLVQKSLIGGHMIVVPNHPDRFGKWPDSLYEADFEFIKETLGKFEAVGHPPVWINFFIANIRPWAHEKSVVEMEPLQDMSGNVFLR